MKWYNYVSYGRNSNSMVETLMNISIQDFDAVTASMPT